MTYSATRRRRSSRVLARRTLRTRWASRSPDPLSDRPGGPIRGGCGPPGLLFRTSHPLRVKELHMADETKFVKNGRNRVAGSPRERVRLKADGWVEVDAFPPPPASGAGSSTAAWQEWAANE